jgi:hypothetical protein
MKMHRTLAVLMGLVCLNVSGCQALAEMAAQQEAQRQAQEAQWQAALNAQQARIAALTPEQRDAVQRCYSTAVGRINTLRNAGQGGNTYGMNDYTVTDACLNNQYYYETIPAPAVVINTPPPPPVYQYQRPPIIDCTTMPMGGGMSSTTCN